MFFSKESDLVLCAVKLLQSQGMSVDTEVAIFNRTIDIVAIRKRYLFSFECKLKDWRRALKQARDHQLVADYSFVCMPERPISATMRESFETTGIGLVLIEDGGTRLMRKIKSHLAKKTFRPAKKELLRRMRE